MNINNLLLKNLSLNKDEKLVLIYLMAQKELRGILFNEPLETIQQLCSITPDFLVRSLVGLSEKGVIYYDFEHEVVWLSSETNLSKANKDSISLNDSKLFSIVSNIQSDINNGSDPVDAFRKAKKLSLSLSVSVFKDENKTINLKRRGRPPKGNNGSDKFSISQRQRENIKKSIDGQGNNNRTKESVPENFELDMTDVDNQQSQFDLKFDEFWSIYPRKSAKADAKKAFSKIFEENKVKDESLYKKIIRGVKAYSKEVKYKEKTMIALGGTWLRAERWNDYPEDELTEDQKNSLRNVWNKFLEAYPKQHNVKHAKKVYYDFLRERVLSENGFGDLLISKALEYREYCKERKIEDNYIKAPDKWIENEGWRDDYAKLSIEQGLKSTMLKNNFNEDEFESVINQELLD